ncbi:hypothetical protein ACTMU2_07755 [Cupriavidus basilensis]
MTWARFLDRATALRLRLRQVSNSPDADAPGTPARDGLFQGKGIGAGRHQAYAQLIRREPWQPVGRHG